jgi:hypothetical protein
VIEQLNIYGEIIFIYSSEMLLLLSELQCPIPLCYLKITSLSSWNKRPKSLLSDPPRP